MIINISKMTESNFKSIMRECEESKWHYVNLDNLKENVIEQIAVNINGLRQDTDSSLVISIIKYEYGNDFEFGFISTGIGNALFFILNKQNKNPMTILYSKAFSTIFKNQESICYMWSSEYINSEYEKITSFIRNSIVDEYVKFGKSFLKSIRMGKIKKVVNI